MMHPLASLSAIADRYDAFIVDLWGVIHDGIAPFPGALDCLRRLAGRPVLLLSNAPRRAASVQGSLRRLGVADTLYTHILTSGEAAWQLLHDRVDPRFASPHPHILHIGPDRDRGVADGLGATLVTVPTEADFVLNTGPDDERESGLLEDFLPDLAACLRSRLPMLCANPDLEIVRGEARILCAGTLAAWYEVQGGDVCWIGKPDPAIYATALGVLNVTPDRVLAVGDSLRTDIAGAERAGIASLWVLGGLHGADLAGDPNAPHRAAAAAKLSPAWITPMLTW